MNPTAPHLLPSTDGFLPEAVFRPFQDLDGAAAAAFLRDHGCHDVTHRDTGRNGLAIGYSREGHRVSLSTNGHLSRDRGDDGRPVRHRFHSHGAVLRREK